VLAELARGLGMAAQNEQLTTATLLERFEPSAPLRGGLEA